MRQKGTKCSLLLHSTTQFQPGSASDGRVLTGVDGAVRVDGGQDAGQRAGGFLLNLVTGQQFELLRRDWREAIKLEGEVDAVGPVGGNSR